METYDALVVGAGPNGLAAAITLQRAGLSVLLAEAASEVGGGMRTGPLTMPGFAHDICAAIHPLAAVSPFMNTLPLHEYGLKWIHPEIPLAHPFENRPAAVFRRCPDETASALGRDAGGYRRLMEPLLRKREAIFGQVLGPPLRMPPLSSEMLRFGIQALSSARYLGKRYFSTREARGLWSGIAAHSMLPLEAPASSAAGLILAMAGHSGGWPLAAGGSAAVAAAMADYFRALGGVIRTDNPVATLDDQPRVRAVLFDTGPRSMLEICGDRIDRRHRKQLLGFRYGMGVFKIDWALSGPVPFLDEACRRAGTVHLGGDMEEVADAEARAWKGMHADRPFVLFAQQSLFDPSRAPEGKHTGWAYCHVPNGSVRDMTKAIEAQVERFAPGFRELILARHTYNTAQMEQYNPNYVGGDIGGGAMDIGRLFRRPFFSRNPYRAGSGGIYLCSASAPPGGGVHGMCGFHAATAALRDVFGISP